MKTIRDVAIIGGGPAGLTAALTLARGGRFVTVFDTNLGRNFPAEHMMNFPSREGTSPQEFRNLIWSDLSKYNEVERQNLKVTDITKDGEHFIVNEKYTFRKILLAHGVKDILPEIPGIRELWGKSVFICPYCHGHEFKGKRISVMSDDENYLSHMVPLLLGLSDHVTVFTNGKVPGEFSFLANRITLITEPVTTLLHHNEKLVGVKLNSGEIVNVDCMVIRAPQEVTTDVGVKLGCELNEFNLYKTNEMGMTTVPGVFAAGDITAPWQSVLIACSSGTKTAGALNFALMSER